MSAIGCVLVIPVLVSCGAQRESQPTAEVPVRPQEAEVACAEFESSLHSWQEGFARATLAIDDAPYVSAQELIELAETLASDLPAGEFQSAFTLELGVPGNNDTPNVDGIEALLEACGSQGVDITAIEFSEEDRQALRAERDREREAARGETTRSRTPTSSAPLATAPSEGDSLQRQALNEMWATTSAGEKAETCEVYRQSPDALIDGFMSSVGDAFNESMVRGFYDSKC